MCVCVLVNQERIVATLTLQFTNHWQFYQLPIGRPPSARGVMFNSIQFNTLFQAQLAHRHRYTWLDVVEGSLPATIFSLMS